jgi:very-short-patch-repair endonuclease
MRRNWTKEEIEFLKKNYANTLDRDLASNLKRGLGAIGYMALKLHLRKDKAFYENSRKHTKIEFNKERLEDFYFNKKKSMRQIAKEMHVGKTTIEHYFKKFNIIRRSHDEARKINPQKYAWTKGLTKSDPRILRIAKGVEKSSFDKRNQKIKLIEEKYGKNLKEIISFLYCDKKLPQHLVAKELGMDRLIIINLMKQFNIPKRPKYQYISSLKGEKHPLFGKSWDNLLGKEKARERREEYSQKFRELTIKRIKNKEFPFFDTEIERIMAKELIKRGIPFVKQFNVNDKFVCDFAIPVFKIIIECDGDYWHANPKLFAGKELSRIQKNNLKRDAYKDKLLFKEGWEVFRFFESDIKKDVSNCVDKIYAHISAEELKKIPYPVDSLMNEEDETDN